MKGQSKVLACTSTMGLSNHHSQHIARISVTESGLLTFVHYRILLLNTCILYDKLWFLLIT